MSWEALKSAVTAVITANGNEEITGQILQDLINNNLIPQLGNGLFKGTATPSTNPGTPEKKEMYLAYENGTYSNFGGLEIQNEVCFLVYNLTSWDKVEINNSNTFDNNINLVANSRLLFLGENNCPTTVGSQSGSPVYVIEDNLFGTKQLRVNLAIGDRFQIKNPFEVKNGGVYSLGFFYKVITGSLTPLVYAPSPLMGTNVGNGTVSGKSMFDGWEFAARENCIATADHSSDTGFLIDIDNRTGSGSVEILITLPTIVASSKFYNKIGQGYDFGFKHLQNKVSENEILVLDIDNTDYIATATTNMSLLELKAGKTYTITATSNDTLASGLRFYKSLPSVTDIKFFAAGSDFANGVSFTFTPDVDLVLSWRVYQVGLTVNFNISYTDSKSSKNTEVLNELYKYDKFYEVENYTTQTTTVFNSVDVKEKQGNAIEVFVQANYTGDFSIYGYEADNSYSILSQINSTDFSTGATFKITIPSDVETLRFRTWQSGVVIPLIWVKGNVLRVDTYKSGLDTNYWSKKIGALFGNSITAQTNGDLQADFTGTKWGELIGKYLDLSTVYARGVGGQKYAWGTNGGSVSFVDSITGNYHSRNDSYNYDNYNGNVAVPSGTTPIRGAFSSWLRITTMFPASIKDTIDFVVIKGSTNDAVDNTDIVWNANDTTDTDWAASSLYPDYGGDYNISTLKGGMASTIMKFQAWMPQAVIVIATPLSGRGTNDPSANNPSAFQTVEFDKSKIVREVAQMFACPVADINAECGINATNGHLYISDGVHPNTDGQRMIARVVSGKMKTILPLNI